MSDEKYIVVLMGGISPEREISLQSGKAVANALSKDNNNVIKIIVNDDMVNELDNYKIDVAFIALHGYFGEDGGIQEVLESKDIPYTGSDPASSQRAFDKSITQILLKNCGIRVPNRVLLSNDDEHVIQESVVTLGGFPLVVKPICEGSSIGISLVRDHAQLKNAVALAQKYSNKIICEEYIQGRELTVGILGDEALPVVEIIAHNDFFDFGAKYTKGRSDYVVPAKLSDSISAELKRVALKAHHSLGCSDFSRVDFILDAHQRYHVLEINTIPGFTSTSLLPMAADCHGLSFNQLCLQLIGMAYGKKEKTQGAAHY